MASRWTFVVLICASFLVIGCAAGSSSAPTAPSAATSQPPPTASDSTGASPSLAAAIAPCDAPAGVSTEVHWTVADEERRALVHPSKRAAAAPASVVLALHGYGGFGMELERVSELSDAADERGWIVAYPEGTRQPQEWSYDRAQLDHAADMDFLRRVIADLAKGGCGDPDRVVVSGISQGGWLADMAGCEMSDQIVGVVSVASRDFGWPCEPAKPVAFAAVSGVLDDVLPYDGGPINAPPPIRSVGSVDDWLAERVASRGCAGNPEETNISPHVTAFTWPGCSAPVALYRVEDGGHSWPNGGGFPPVNRELSVTDIIADMLEAPVLPH